MRLTLSVSGLFLSFVFCPAQTRVEKLDALLGEIHSGDAFSGNVLVAEKGKSFTSNHLATPTRRRKRL